MIAGLKEKGICVMPIKSITSFVLILTVLIFIAPVIAAAGPTINETDIVVSVDGSGDYLDLQTAIDEADDGSRSDIGITGGNYASD